MAWNLFRKALQIVFRNLGMAFRIFVPTILLFAVIMAVAMAASLANPYGGMSAGYGLFLLLASLANIVLMTWLFVAWFRYILLAERPGGLLPQWRGPEIWASLLRGLLIVLIMLGCFVALGVVLGVPVALMAETRSGAGAGMILLGLLGLAAMLALYVLGMRLSTSLPGMAIGAPLSLRETLARTKGQGWTYLAVLLLVIVFVILAEIPYFLLIFLAQAGGGAMVVMMILMVAYMAVFQMVATVLGATLLCVFYGHYVEGRSLD